ncbi:hypothetical protein FRC04_002787 [Tulasnella sp. 424]|nr:hypothetical protein FRC04_002787 [Tulasnella sp. 424]
MEEVAGECVLSVDVSLTLLFRKWLRVALTFLVGRSDEPAITLPPPVPLTIMEVGRSLGDPGNECVDAIARSVGVGDVTLAEAEANFGDEEEDEATGFALAGPPMMLLARGIAIVAELPAGIADLSFCWNSGEVTRVTGDDLAVTLMGEVDRARELPDRGGGIRTGDLDLARGWDERGASCLEPKVLVLTVILALVLTAVVVAFVTMLVVERR